MSTDKTDKPERPETDKPERPTRTPSTETVEEYPKMLYKLEPKEQPEEDDEEELKTVVVQNEEEEKKKLGEGWSKEHPDTKKANARTAKQSATPASGRSAEAPHTAVPPGHHTEQQESAGGRKK